MRWRSGGFSRVMQIIIWFGIALFAAIIYLTLIQGAQAKIS